MSEILRGVTLEMIEPMPEKKIWTGSFDFVHDGFNQDINLRGVIERYVTDPGNFLGEGGAGKVFDLGEGRCIKIMPYRHKSSRAEMFDLGNRPEEEARIQNLVRNFVVEDVYAPVIVASYLGKEAAAIIMEQLDAVNLQMVLSGKDQLPEKFELDDFFYRLEAYIEALNKEKGIIHNDLEPRNIMIDRKTGLPRVIDFGRSIDLNRANRFIRSSLKNMDIININKILTKMDTFLNG